MTRNLPYRETLDDFESLPQISLTRIFANPVLHTLTNSETLERISPGSEKPETVTLVERLLTVGDEAQRWMLRDMGFIIWTTN
jgi:hypothetical protein